MFRLVVRRSSAHPRKRRRRHPISYETINNPLNNKTYTESMRNLENWVNSNKIPRLKTERTYSLYKGNASQQFLSEIYNSYRIELCQELDASVLHRQNIVRPPLDSPVSSIDFLNNVEDGAISRKPIAISRTKMLLNVFKCWADVEVVVCLSLCL